MTTGRLEAFSDGVIAVIITITVLDLHVPRGTTLASFEPQVTTFFAYVLSFVNVGVYWNNHHHLFAAANRVDGRTMWANLNLLFWLSLIPFTTGWFGQNVLVPLPTATYGFVLMMCGVSYVLLQAAVVAAAGPTSKLATAFGSDWKGKLSLGSYVLSVPIAFILPVISGLIFVAVAALWLFPDRRIERAMESNVE